MATYKIQYRRSTAAAAAASNPVLGAGEPGLETDTGKTKLGDGVTAWNLLPYDAPNATVLSSTYVAMDISLPAVAKGLGILPNNPAHEVGPAWDAAMTLLVGKVGGILDISPNGERWYTARPPQAGIGGGQFAQLPLPNIQPGGDSAPVIVLHMARPSRMPHFMQYSQSTAGPAIVSTYATGVRVSGKNPSVIGGLAKDPDNTSLTFSAAGVICDGLHIQVPDNPTLTGLDMSGMSQASMRGQCTVETIGTPFPPTPCTSPWAYGVIMPGINNNTVCNVEHLDVLGFYGNFAYNEHAVITHLGTYYGIVARVPYGCFGHSSIFTYVCDELCRYGVAIYSPVDGTPTTTLNPTGQATWTDEHWDVEHHTTGNFTRVLDINDPYNLFRVRGRVSKVYSGSSLTGGNMWVAGAAGCIYVDNASLNPASVDSGLGRTVLNPASDGGRWVQDVGGWSVDASGIGMTTPAYYGLLTRQTEFSNGRIGATIGAGTGGGESWGLAFRVQGPNTHYLLYPVWSGAQLFKIIAGVSTPITLTPPLPSVALVVGDRWEVEYRGAQYRVFKNDAFMGSGFDDTLLSGCKVGLYCSSSVTSWSRFTNFNATP